MTTHRYQRLDTSLGSHAAERSVSLAFPQRSLTPQEPFLGGVSGLRSQDRPPPSSSGICLMQLSDSASTALMKGGHGLTNPTDPRRLPVFIRLE